MAQNIILDANTCFFSPKGTLMLYGETKVNNEYNANLHYDRIGEWRNINDTIVWGIKNMKPGTLKIELFAGISEQENNSVVTIFIDNKQQDLVLKSTQGMEDYQSQGILSFTVDKAGTHEIKIKIKSKNTEYNLGEIKKLILSGSAIEGANVWIRRWRAAAIHATFMSEDNINTEISVYEINIISKEFDSYQVMSTEFGYIGSPNQSSSMGLKGLNFSLWSYSENEIEPPHNELSHLIAVGGITNGFGRYGHEGTGVKPRGFDPFNNSSSPNYKFTIAVRKVPGLIYNTYWCYYLDPIISHWKLYSCGRTYNSKGRISYLNNTGGFLEIVGQPKNSRTGHRTRIIEYRAWRMQTDKSWYVLNKMSPFYNSATQLSYKEWTQNSDGDKFIFKSGGFAESPNYPGIIELNKPSDIPFFLKGNYVEELYQMPSVFETLNPEYVLEEEASLRFDIKKLGTNPEIKLYYGTEYGLTEGITQNYIIDKVWQDVQELNLSAINNNTLSVKLTHLIPNTKYYYRLRIKNDEGITWSLNADTFITDDITLDIGIDEKTFLVYPNPTNGKINLKIDNINNSKLKLYNATGKLMLSQKRAKKEIDIKHLVSGIYYLELTSQGKTKVIKIIKK